MTIRDVTLRDGVTGVAAGGRAGMSGGHTAMGGRRRTALEP